MRVLVNADDLGLSPGVNRGILEAWRAGALSRASAMPNMPAFAEGLRLAAAEPGLALGVHATFTCGAPLSSPAEVPSLVGADGRFPGLSGFLLRAAAGLLSPAELRRELEAQIRRFKAEGPRPGHLDSHHHVHYLPVLAPLFFEAARDHGIPYVRWGRPAPAESAAAWPPAALRAGLRNRALSALRSRRPLPGGLRSAEWLCGLSHAAPGGYASALARSLDALPEGEAELVCHPGRMDSDLRREDPWTMDREEELSAFCGPLLARLKAAGLRAAGCP